MRLTAIKNFIISLWLSCLTTSALAKAEDASVEVLTLKQQPVRSTLYLSGNLKARQESQLSVPVSALVQAIYVDVGHEVKKGETLLSLDNAIAEQEYARNQSQLSSARIAHAEAERLLAEAKQMRVKNHIGESEFKARETAERLRQSELNQAQAEFRIAEKRLAQHRLTAPFDGVISERNAELGEWLQPGSVAFTLVTRENTYLDLQVPQEHLSAIKHLSSATIFPDSTSHSVKTGTKLNPELGISAEIETVVPVADAARTFLLRLLAKTMSDFLLPGGSASAHLIFEHPNQQLLLPRDALLRSVDDSFSVFIIEDNQARRRKVELGESHEQGYWVINGLQEGDSVVIRGNELLNEGQTVSVTQRRVQQP